MTAQQKRHQKVNSRSFKPFHHDYSNLVRLSAGDDCQRRQTRSERERKVSCHALASSNNVAKGIFRGPTIQRGKGGGGVMGDLVWVRIFSKPLEIEFPYIIFQH